MGDYARPGEGVFVDLNPLLAQAVAGGQHIRIDLKEARKLASGPNPADRRA